MADVQISNLQSVGGVEARSGRLPAVRAQNDSTPLRDSAPNPDTVDRTRGTGSGGVSADRIGFSREITPEQRVSKLRQADIQASSRETLSSGSRGEPASADSSITYGPNGKISASTGESATAQSPIRQSQTGTVASPVTPSATAIPPEPSPQEFRLAAAGGQLESRGRSDVADQRALETSQSAASVRTQREGQLQERSQRNEAVVAQAQRNGEAQNTEPTAPAAADNAITRQRLASAYQTVPRDVASKISLFA